MRGQKKQNSSEMQVKQKQNILFETQEKKQGKNLSKSQKKKAGGEKKHHRMEKLSRLLQYLCSSSGSQPCAPQPGWNAETAMLSALRSDHLEENSG
jgi:hypothetical protein